MEKVLLMEKVYSLWPSSLEDSIVVGKKSKAKTWMVILRGCKIYVIFKKIKPNFNNVA